LADDPSLNVRLSPDALGLEPDQAVRQPQRIVVDSRLRIRPSARLLRLPGTTWVACVEADPARRAALEAAGAEILIAPATSDGQVDLGWLWAELARREVNELLIESGPTLAGVALRAGLVDEIILYLAPHLMGDAARGLFRLPGLARMAERIPLAFTDIRQVGPDLRLTLRPRASRSGRSSPVTDHDAQ
ncbi:dihydrofolate reductase family protein, partial [Thioalkalicoccus limnaeus]